MSRKRGVTIVLVTHNPEIAWHAQRVISIRDGEIERDDLASTIARVLAKDYSVEERMTLWVRVKLGGKVVYETWALNEASVEKASRERVIEVIIEVDGRPLSTFGCDGVVMATPTGSTAYAFSAGGPVVWPSVDAMLLVPLSAHALFARPLVVGPDSSLAVELLERTDATGERHQPWTDPGRGPVVAAKLDPLFHAHARILTLADHPG